MKRHMKLFLANGREIKAAGPEQLPGSRAPTTPGLPSRAGLDQKSVVLFLTVALMDVP